MYNQLAKSLNKLSDDKFRHISIKTFVYLAKQVSYITAIRGVDHWDRIKDIDSLAYLIEQLSEHIGNMPNDTQNLANDIFGYILEIKNDEEEKPKNEKTYNEIKRLVGKITNKLKGFGNY